MFLGASFFAIQYQLHAFNFNVHAKLDEKGLKMIIIGPRHHFFREEPTFDPVIEVSDHVEWHDVSLVGKTHVRTMFQQQTCSERIVVLASVKQRAET